jgi:serine/threonine protein kinase
VLYSKERAGVVHRDIKPANILISKDGNLKLADFGIAKPRDLSKHTSSVHVIGSSFYISPEQFQKKKLDFRADIYSLGCVIFEMITGCKAFDYDNISDLVMAKMNNSYNEALLYDCPEKFVSIISQCIQPLKEDRFANIEEVMAAVESQLNYYSIQDPRELIRNYVDSPDTISFPASPPKRRRPVPYLIALFSVPLVIIILFLIIFLKKPSEDYSPVRTDAPAVSDTGIVEDADIPEMHVLTEPAKMPEIPKPITPVKKEIAPKNVIEVPALKPEISGNVSISEGYDAFINKNYDKCISIFSRKSNLNDTYTLCYLGSLLETGKMSKLSDRIDKRAIRDGYYYYLKGRVAFYNKDFIGSNEYFVKALTAKSFYKNLQFYSHYYIAKSRTSIFLEKPNTVNKNIMHKSQERFLANYCQDVKSSECNDIKTLSEKYK